MQYTFQNLGNLRSSLLTSFENTSDYIRTSVCRYTFKISLFDPDPTLLKTSQRQTYIPTYSIKSS
jgi:hypothetical protein